MLSNKLIWFSIDQIWHKLYCSVLCCIVQCLQIYLFLSASKKDGQDKVFDDFDYFTINNFYLIDRKKKIIISCTAKTKLSFVLLCTYVEMR